MQTEPTAGVSIFVSNAQQDRTLQQELEVHLRPLQREGLISLWSDTGIHERVKEEREVDQHLNTAQIILLLISPDYINSDHCYHVTMKRALERHERGEARVIPIILRHVYLERTPLRKLQVLPIGDKSVMESLDRGRVWRDLVQTLCRVIDEILQQSNRA